MLLRGYGARDFRDDLFAGLTVAIVALPLAMALGIASGASPDKGLITAVVAGFLISLLGGSRHQIGGPTGAFVVVVYGVISQFGYDGLLIATLMAGAILMLAALCRLGETIRHIPAPVITGFTAGIAIIILCSQLRDYFGLNINAVPGEFLEKLAALWAVHNTADAPTVTIATVSLVLIIALRQRARKFPAYLAAIVAASVVVALFDMQVETIGSMFGGIPHAIPAPSVPDGIDGATLLALLPSALTIAFLAGIESLLSAVIADKSTGTTHKPNAELAAQGVANVASALFGGLPATGALARTATNIRSGAKSPMAGMLHAAFLLLFMMAFAGFASYIPLAALAAVLVVVAWTMAQSHEVLATLRDGPAAAAVLLVTLALTVLSDITVAIVSGLLLSLILKRLSAAPSR